MIKFEHTETVGWEPAIRGMRNPMNSWDKSDSGFKIMNEEDVELGYEPIREFVIGENDLKLMKQLCKAGTDHRKFMRMITVYVDITAPRMWWTEFDTYRVGVEKNSCSTMHTIHKKEFTLDDFSLDEISILNKKPEQKRVPIIVEKEEWIEVASIPNVMVSNSGRVKTKAYQCQISDGRIFNYKEKEIATSEDGGYVKCSIHMFGKRYNCKLHRLMAEAFIEKENGRPYINHKDGNKLNNNLSNLEWVSASENAQHAQDNGLVFWDEKSREEARENNRSLNDTAILNIIKLRLEGNTIKEISNTMDVSNTVISRICSGEYFSKEKTPMDIMNETIDELNKLRCLYLRTKNKMYWRMMIEMLPQSYNQKRTVMMSYETLANMYHARKNHKLDEWHDFCRWIETLPYSELITGEEE